MSIWRPMGGFILGAMVMAGLANQLSAQTTFEGEVSPWVGGTFYLSDPPAQFRIHGSGNAPSMLVEKGHFQDAVTYGLNAGVRINARYGIELLASWVPTDLQAPGGLDDFDGKVGADVFMYGVAFAYHFVNSSKLQPFVGGGFGGETMTYDPKALEGHTEFMGQFLAGVNLEMSDAVAIRFDVRDCVTRFNSEVSQIGHKNANDLMFSVGLNLKTMLN